MTMIDRNDDISGDELEFTKEGDPILKPHVEFDLESSAQVTLNIKLTSKGIYTQMKRAIVETAMKVAKGHKPDAAKILGVSLKTLYNWLKEFQMYPIENTDQPAALSNDR